MKVYISGPINTSIPGLDREEAKARFNRCEKWIRENREGWSVVNPLKVDPCVDPDAIKCEEGLENIYTHSWECWLRYDLKAMLDCDGIVMLPHAEESLGARLEIHVARALKFVPFYADATGKVVM